MKKPISEQEFRQLIRDGVKDFSGYTMNVVELYCAYNNLTALPDLPNVVELYCSDNQLTALPELPQVVKLDCDDNQLTALPNYIDSPTSGRSVVYLNGKILTGCFCGTLEEFYQKGYVQEGKEWVKNFYEKMKA
jgi:hypothetical protein